VFSFTFSPIYPSGKTPPVPTEYKGGWAPNDKFEKRLTLSMLGIEHNSSELKAVK
jgi:hypothetical protein